MFFLVHFVILAKAGISGSMPFACRLGSRPSPG